MSDGTLTRSYGKVFNEVAVVYDRNRPTYPDALVDRACAVAGIGDGSRVLEIGCGTGQLTRSLLARGLRVTALEPGERVDPDLGWRKIAHALAPNGTLALIQYFGLQEQRTADDQEAVLSALRTHAGEIAATWPIYRDLDRMSAGVRASSERRRCLELAGELRHRT